MRHLGILGQQESAMGRAGKKTIGLRSFSVLPPEAILARSGSCSFLLVDFSEKDSVLPYRKGLKQKK
jgi:hypothetical protein